MTGMMRLITLTFALVAAALTAPAQTMHHMHGGGNACAGLSLDCAQTATPVFAPDGRLYLAWATTDHVMVARATDAQGHLGPGIAVNAEPARIDPGPDARPSIAIDPKGHVFVAYTVLSGENYVGRVYIARSLDGGGSFGAPQPITDNTASQRFTRLIADRSGRILASWIDKREIAAARESGKAYPGAALAFAWWDATHDGFTPARIAQSDSCECCRVAAALDRDGHPVVAFRNIFDTHVRDHAVTAFDGKGEPGPVRRVSIDDWQTDVCPHQGPDIAVGADGAYHVVWFTQGSRRQGLFYARSSDEGAHFTKPMALGDPDKAPSRARVLAVGRTVWLAWKEFDGTVSTIRATHSADGGKHWSAPRTLAETRDASDQPILAAGGGHAYLSWLTHGEGYRLIDLDKTP